MSSPETSVVTGAFGYTGRYITERLLSLGGEVRALTRRSQEGSPFGERVRAYAADFGNRETLAETLRGADVLYNTYWVRFPRDGMTFDGAVRNVANLVRAAEEAGVRRIVHVSLPNASEDSPLPYYRGKGTLERIVRDSSLSHAIVRPALIFGREEILLNNIAWLLRRFPVFPIFGSGRYRIQPIYVEDLASMIVQAGQGQDDTEFDAGGPETYTFEELVRLLRMIVESKARLVHLPPALAPLLANALGLLVRDVVLTRDELRGLMVGHLVCSGPPRGEKRLSEWLAETAPHIGAGYTSELARHF